MKIIDVAEFYAERGGGVRTYLDQKLSAATSLGHELMIVAPGPEDRVESRNGGRIAWVRSPKLPLDPRYYMLTRERAVHALLDRETPDVIEGSSPWAGGLFVARYRPPGARKRAVRRSFVFHQDPIAVYPQVWLGRYLGEARVDALFTPFWRYLRALSRRFDWTVVGGHWLATRLATQGVHNPTAVPFGIDRSPFHEVQPDLQLRAALLARCGAPPDAALLLCVSRLHPEKRVSTLLRALSLVAAKRPVALVIYGDGPFAASLARQAHGLPVCFAGHTRDRERLATALASAHALVHGGAAETFGLVIAEALAAGLPVVVPERGGAADFARGEHAELYSAGDARACAHAIERMLRRDREQLRLLSRAAAARLVRPQHEHFEQLFALYADRQ